MNVPYEPLKLAVAGVAKIDSPVSESDMVKDPVAAVELSSVTLPVLVPEMVGTSFAPAIVTVIT